MMFAKVAKFGEVFGGHVGKHPLADVRELRRIIGELPRDNAFKALDELVGWLESLLATDEISPDRLCEAVRQLDEAAQPFLKRLAREYLNTPRLPRSEEKRLWSINFGFWQLLANVYERCLPPANEENLRVAESLKAALPQVAARLIFALGAVLKWEQFHYGPTRSDLWRRMGGALLMAEKSGVAGKMVPQFGGGATSPQQEYLKAMVFQAASLDSLLPLEIELAERLLNHFLPAFVFSPNATHDMVYWADLAQAQAPLRMAKMPVAAGKTLRFFKPAAAHEEIVGLLHAVERGEALPPELNLGSAYPAKTLVPVLRHLAAYLAPIPPQRRHERYRVKHRMSVLNGLINAFVVFSGDFGGRPAGLPIESWVVDNVSRGGFGAALSNIPAEWLHIGALVALQPEGGENWLLGVVRRYHREAEKEVRVGIESLARQVRSVELRPRTVSSYAAVSTIPSLLLLDGGENGEVRVILPPASFDLRERMEYVQDGRRIQLNPVALIEQTTDYELARYRPEAGI